MRPEGVVFDIQHFSVHDGPGIRTNVFLKGCPLRCRWCSNPESQAFRPEMTFEKRLCIGCGECAGRCQHGAVKSAADLSVCDGCGGHDCLAGCYARALKLAGEVMTVDAVMTEVLRDREFYGGGGGVTFTGGEPFAQSGFLRALLEAAKSEGVTTAVETCLCVAWENIASCAEPVDTFLCDIKHVDAAKLRECTGADFRLFEANLDRLLALRKEPVARVPVIPGFNDTPEELAAIDLFAAGKGIRRVEHLKYHEYGKAKYAKLGRPYPMDSAEISNSISTS